MNKNDIRTPEDALAYFTDCQLATVEELATKKSRTKWDYYRQKLIAQNMCDCLRDFKIVDEGNRYNDVVKCGDVEAWAKTMEPETTK